MHYFLEYPPSMFVALELIKAGAGRSEKNGIARRGRFAGASDGIFQSLRMFDFSALNLRFDLGGCGTNGVDAFHSLPQ